MDKKQFHILYILVLWSIFFVYFKNICEVVEYDKTGLPKGDCRFEWLVGLFLNISFSLSRLYFVLFDKKFSLLSFYVVSLILYTISFGLFALPFMIVSFLQPFIRNSFMHFVIFSVCFDSIFLFFTHKRYKRLPETDENVQNKLEVKSAQYLDGYRLEIQFSDGETRIVNFRASLERQKVFEYRAYLDPEKFRQFTVENGNLVWGEDWDLSYPVWKLYEGSV